MYLHVKSQTKNNEDQNITPIPTPNKTFCGGL